MSNLVFGKNLESILEREHHDPARRASGVPHLVHTICEYLLKSDALGETGIFRLSGSGSDLRRLEEVYDGGATVDVEMVCKEPFAVANLLKHFLRRLPDPLFTAKLYPSFVAMGQAGNAGATVAALCERLRTLPIPNRVLLKYLLRFFSRVAERSEENRMNPTNLAVVIGPTILRMPGASAEDDLRDYAAVNRVATLLFEHMSEVIAFITDLGNAPPVAPHGASEEEEEEGESAGSGSTEADADQQQQPRKSVNTPQSAHDSIAEDLPRLKGQRSALHHSSDSNQSGDTQEDEASGRKHQFHSPSPQVPRDTTVPSRRTPRETTPEAGEYKPIRVGSPYDTPPTAAPTPSVTIPSRAPKSPSQKSPSAAARDGSPTRGESWRERAQWDAERATMVSDFRRMQSETEELQRTLISLKAEKRDLEHKLKDSQSRLDDKTRSLHEARERARGPQTDATAELTRELDKQAAAFAKERHEWMEERSKLAADAARTSALVAENAALRTFSRGGSPGSDDAAALAAEVERLKGELLLTRRQATAAPSGKSEWDKERNALLALTKSLRTDKESAEASLAQARRQLAEFSKSESAAERQRVATVVAEHAQLMDEVATERAAREHAEAAVSPLRAEVERLRAELSSSESERSTLESRMRTMATEKETLRTRARECENTSEKLRKELDAALEGAASQRAEWMMDRARLDAALATYRAAATGTPEASASLMINTEIPLLKAEVDSARRERDQLARDLEAAQKRAEEGESARREHAILMVQLDRARERLARMEEDSLRPSDKEKSLRDELDRVKRSLARATSDLAHARRGRASGAVGDADSVSSSHGSDSAMSASGHGGGEGGSGTRYDRAHVRAELASAREEIARLGLDISMERTKREAAEARMEQMRRDARSRTGPSSDDEEELRVLREALSHARHRIKGLEEDLKEAQRRGRGEKKDRSRARTDADAEADVDDSSRWHREELERAKDENRELLETLHSMKHLNDELEQLRLVNQDLEVDAQAARAELHRMKRERASGSGVTSGAASGDEGSSEGDLTLGKLRRQNETMAAELDRLRKDNAQLELELSDAQAQIKGAPRSPSGQTPSAHAELKQLRGETTKLAGDLQQARTQAQKEQGARDAADRLAAEAAATARRLEKQNEALLSEIGALQKEISDIEDGGKAGQGSVRHNNSDSNMNLSGSPGSSDRHTRENARLQRELERVKGEVVRLETELKESSARRFARVEGGAGALQDEIDRLRTENTRLKSAKDSGDAGASEREKAAMEAEMNRMREELVSLGVRLEVEKTPRPERSTRPRRTRAGAGDSSSSGSEGEGRRLTQQNAVLLSQVARLRKEMGQSEQVLAKEKAQSDDQLRHYAQENIALQTELDKTRRALAALIEANPGASVNPAVIAAAMGKGPSASSAQMRTAARDSEIREMQLELEKYRLKVEDLESQLDRANARAKRLARDESETPPPPSTPDGKNRRSSGGFTTEARNAQQTVELKGQIERLEQRCSGLLAELDRSNEARLSLQAQVSQMVANSRSGRTVGVAAEDRVIEKQLRAEVLHLEQKVETLTHQLEALRKQKAGSRHTSPRRGRSPGGGSDDLGEEVRVLRRQLSMLTRSVSDAERNGDVETEKALLEEVDRLKGELSVLIEDLEHTRSRGQSRATSPHSSVASVVADSDAMLREQLAQARRENAALMLEIDILREGERKSRPATPTKAPLGDDSAARVASLEREVERFRRENQSLLNELSTLHTLLPGGRQDDSSKEIERLQGQIELLTFELNELRAASPRRGHAPFNEDSSNAAALRSVREELRTTKSELDRTRSELDRTKAELERVRNELAFVRKTASSNPTPTGSKPGSPVFMSEAEKMLDMSLRDQVTKMRDDTTRLGDELQKTREQRNIFEDELDTAREELSRLKKELQEARRVLGVQTGLSEKSAAEQKLNDSLVVQLEKAKAENSLMSVELREARLAELQNQEDITRARTTIAREREEMKEESDHWREERANLEAEIKELTRLRQKRDTNMEDRAKADNEAIERGFAKLEKARKQFREEKDQLRLERDRFAQEIEDRREHDRKAARDKRVKAEEEVLRVRHAAILEDPTHDKKTIEFTSEGDDLLWVKVMEKDESAWNEIKQQVERLRTEKKALEEELDRVREHLAGAKSPRGENEASSPQKHTEDVLRDELARAQAEKKALRVELALVLVGDLPVDATKHPVAGTLEQLGHTLREALALANADRLALRKEIERLKRGPSPPPLRSALKSSSGMDLADSLNGDASLDHVSDTSHSMPSPHLSRADMSLEILCALEGRPPPQHTHLAATAASAEAGAAQLMQLARGKPTRHVPHTARIPQFRPRAAAGSGVTVVKTVKRGPVIPKLNLTTVGNRAESTGVLTPPPANTTPRRHSPLVPRDQRPPSPTSAHNGYFNGVTSSQNYSLLSTATRTVSPRHEGRSVSFAPIPSTGPSGSRILSGFDFDSPPTSPRVNSDGLPPYSPNVRGGQGGAKKQVRYLSGRPGAGNARRDVPPVRVGEHSQNTSGGAQSPPVSPREFLESLRQGGPMDLNNSADSRPW